MEDSRILNWRRWSLTRKTQVVGTAFGFLLTAAFMLGDALQITLPRNWLGNQIWGVGMLLGRPTDAVLRLLGVSEVFRAWGGRVLVLSVNGPLGFVLGTILGWLITMVKHTRNRRNR